VTALIAERMVVRMLEAAVDEPVPMSFSSLTARRMCLVEVHAGGAVGVGESWVNYPAWAPAERMATLLDGVAPLVLGSDVSDPAAVLIRLDGALHGLARQWGARGPIWQAMSAVDLALWDLRGRLEHKPVGELLGSARRSAPVYASGVGPSQVERLCERAIRLGITAVKAKVGFGDEIDRSTISAIRAAGPHLRVFADANCAWTPEEAARQAATLRDEGVEWLEEPLASPSRASLEELHERTGMALAAGENVYGLDDLDELAHIAGLSLVQPDPAKSGGITTVADLIDRVPEGCRVSPHWYAGAIGLRASLALVTAFDCAAWLELDLRTNSLRDDLLTEGFGLDADGRMPASRVPGLVADLDHERVLAFQVTVDERTAA